MTGRTQHEAAEQEALFEWAEWVTGKIPDIDLLYHIPNGGSRHPKEAANLKRQGVKAGVPDLCLPAPRGELHGLYIEMKAGKNKPTDLQEKWIERLRGNGYQVEVCYSWQEASRVIMRYLKL